jgi:hypothetical protein
MDMARLGKMLDSGALTEILAIDRLHLPAEPRVVDVRVDEVEDWSGEDSLEVFVILPDDASDEDHRWANIAPVYKAIRQALRDAGETRFAYFTSGTRADYEGRYSNDPDADE